MDVLLVYSLLLIFFLGLIPVLWLVLQERGPETSEKPGHANLKQQAGSEIGVDKVTSYGLLGAILAFMLILTVLIRRGQS